jgi:hypothetical protein
MTNVEKVRKAVEEMRLTHEALRAQHPALDIPEFEVCRVMLKTKTKLTGKQVRNALDELGIPYRKMPNERGQE